MTPITNVDSLALHPTKTEMNQITLKLLQKYYEDYLLPYTFIFHLEGGDDPVRLQFKKDHFCHLIGTNHPAQKKYNNNPKMLYQYFGKKGYSKIRQGSITIETLRKLHRSEFDQTTKKKCKHFHFLHRMLDKPNIVKSINSVGNIVCDFYFFNEFDNSYVHLGIEQEDGQHIYFPKTFVIKYVASQTADRFFAGQTPVALVSTQKIDNRTNTVVPTK